MITQASLEALLKLLDEPERGRVEPLIGQLAAMPQADFAAILEHAGSMSAHALRHLQAAATRARFRAAEAGWRQAVTGRLELEAALCALSATGPLPQIADIPELLDDLGREVGAGLSGDRAYDSGLQVLAEVLGRAHGMQGNSGDYYAPENSYLGCVLHSGQGNPITLCCVALLVGRRLELPVWGLNSPGHFLGFYGDVHLGVGTCFDPFDGYKRVNSGQVKAILGQFVEAVTPEMLKPASDHEILARIIRNLAVSYQRLGDAEQQQNLGRWLEIMAG